MTTKVSNSEVARVADNNTTLETLVGAASAVKGTMGVLFSQRPVACRPGLYRIVGGDLVGPVRP